MKNIRFLVVLNKSFMPGFKALMNSILLHTPNFKHKVICLDIDLDDTDKERCIKIYNNTMFVKPLFENYINLPKHSYVLKNAFYKLEAFRLSEKYDKLICLDCDLVFLKSIECIINHKPSGKPLELSYEGSSYNTGLMILPKSDPKLYKSIMRLLSTMTSAHLADQYVIIEAIKKRIIEVSQLDIYWNYTKRSALKNGLDNVLGLHFVGKKPWQGSEEGYESLESVWFKYG